MVYNGAVRHRNDMHIADMDGDGRLDIIERTRSSEWVVVSLQNEDINTWTTRIFDTGETGKPEGISAGDIGTENKRSCFPVSTGIIQDYGEQEIRWNIYLTSNFSSIK